jgi:hypothetical protein
MDKDVAPIALERRLRARTKIQTWVRRTARLGLALPGRRDACAALGPGQGADRQRSVALRPTDASAGLGGGAFWFRARVIVGGLAGNAGRRHADRPLGPV